MNLSLRPCPFCGGKATVARKGPHGKGEPGWSYGGCRRCGSTGPPVDHMRYPIDHCDFLAGALWNQRRVTEEAATP